MFQFLTQYFTNNSDFQIQDIIICMDYKVKINSLNIFKHEKDGLRLWEAGIILSRFLFKNKLQFENKQILELGAGVGLASIVASKFANASNVFASDRDIDALKNIEFNIKQNICKNCQSLNLNWNEYESFEQKFDIIIGSDLIYSGSPFENLSKLIYKSLNEGGKAYIIIPNDRFCKQQFLDYMKDFKLEIISLDKDEYQYSPFNDEVKGYQQYIGLKSLKFDIYVFTK